MSSGHMDVMTKIINFIMLCVRGRSGGETSQHEFGIFCLYNESKIKKILEEKKDSCV